MVLISAWCFWEPGSVLKSDERWYIALDNSESDLFVCTVILI